MLGLTLRVQVPKYKVSTHNQYITIHNIETIATLYWVLRTLRVNSRPEAEVLDCSQHTLAFGPRPRQMDVSKEKGLQSKAPHDQTTRTCHVYLYPYSTHLHVILFCLHVYIQICMHAYIYTYIYTCMYTYTRIQMQTHMQICISVYAHCSSRISIRRPTGSNTFFWVCVQGS